MAEKVQVQKVGVEKVQGFLYFLDKQGDISRVVAARGKKKGGKPSKVLRVGVKRDNSKFIYYINKKGDIWRAKRANAG
jgi:hypothetical protein